MTFIDSEGNFGALGHGISDVDAGITMEVKSGTLYETRIIAVRKGEKGNPGEMTGMIEYSGRNILGEITENSNQGIYGVCNEKCWKNNRGAHENSPAPGGGDRGCQDTLHHRQRDRVL